MKRVRDNIAKTLQSSVSVAPLLTFRIVFGAMMMISTIRFLYNDWVHELYIKPVFHFTYYGFDFVKVLPSLYMYMLYGVLIIASLAIIFGLFYRLAALAFFLVFTYIELIDKSYYLNHYYFVTLISFLMIFLPAGKIFSIDNFIKNRDSITEVPLWIILSIKGMIGIVYFYAGIAKINSDWFIHALPLKIWLQAKYDMPIIGTLLTQKWVAYAFSWAGCLFDTTIFFFLLYKKTRIPAYITVVVFHLLTGQLFPIGMFPYIMIASTIIFFEDNWHKKIQKIIGCKWNEMQQKTWQPKYYRIVVSIFFFFFVIQIFLPFRYLLYKNNNLFWTEEGYRFSWRVMLMEKAGYITFYVKDNNHKKTAQIDNYDYLTPYQIKMMSTQPDMILQYAHHLRDSYIKKGFEDPEVYATSYVSLQGRGSRLYIDSTVNLAVENDNFSHKKWILDAE